MVGLAFFSIYILTLLFGHGVHAFAPVPESTRITASSDVDWSPSRRRMSDETATADSATATTPTRDLFIPPERVPCFGAAPFLTTDVFFGQNYWDKLTMEYGTAETGTFLRAAELKHGRAAMLATVGYAFEKFGITFDKFSPHEYLSVTQNIKFADLAMMSPLEAIKAVPTEGFIQLFCAIAAIEFYELTHKDGVFQMDLSVAPGLQAGGLTGDIGFNPLQIKVDERRRLVELQNGRAAMFAITAWVAEEAIPGSVPLDLPW